MRLHEKYTWLASFPKRDWLNYLSTSNQNFNSLTPRQRKDFILAAIEEVIIEISAGNVGQSMEVISLCLCIDKEYSLEHLKMRGVLRHSTYLNKRNPIPGIAKYILDNATGFQLAPPEQEYFNSLIHLLAIYRLLDKTNKEINAELFKWKSTPVVSAGKYKLKTSRVKALLAINEINFIIGTVGDKVARNYTEYDFYSKEEISEAISFLIFRHDELIGFQEHDLLIIDDSFITNGAESLIARACFFKSLKELEIEVESFGYICVKSGAKLLIKHPDEEFEKSLVLSNVHYQLQSGSNTYFNRKGSNAARMMELAKSFHTVFPDFFKLEESPFPRYVLKVPPQIISAFLAKEPMEFFREELDMLEMIERELMIDLSKLKNYQIVPGFSYYEFLKLTRFFALHACLINTKYNELISDGDNTLLFRSVVPVIKEDDLELFLSIIADHKSVKAFLNLISWTPETAKAGFLDLQYRPLIKFNGKYMFGFNIAGLSNLSRSIFLSESKKGNNMKVSQVLNHISIPALLMEAFSKHGFLVAKEIKINYKSGVQTESDIDFFAYKDGVMFIAECKDTIHPIDIFEMRTTLGHLKKAAKQIKYVLEAFSNPAFFLAFCTKMGIKSSDVYHIQPAIVQSNNKFWGYNFEGIPVRNYREISHFLSNGYWNMSLYESTITQFKLWADDEFEVKDIIDFCSSTGPHEAMYKGCESRSYLISKNITRETFAVLMTKVVDELKKKYSFKEIPLPGE